MHKQPNGRRIFKIFKTHTESVLIVNFSGEITPVFSDRCSGEY